MKLLSSANVLVHFDSTKEVTLAYDASPYGIGTILSHMIPDESDRPSTHTREKVLTIRKRGPFLYLWNQTVSLTYMVVHSP